MKVELHLHTNRYSLCGKNSPEEMMSALLACGYEAVYITEHDKVWSPAELEELRAEFPALRIFGGIERSLNSNMASKSGKPTNLVQHVLVLGTCDPDYTKIETVPALLNKARNEGHLVILAHPFRWEGTAAMLDHGFRPDAIEHRSKNHSAENALRSATVAHEIHLPLVNASDGHAVDHVGQYWIETLRPIVQADDIRNIVIEGAYEMRISE